MRTTLIMIVLLALTGCAHATIHEICSNPDVVSRYRDYDQCYAEESAIRQRKEEARKLFARSWGSLGSNNNVQCTSIQNGSFTNTTCH
jgi:hypothetical protein